MVFNGLVSVFSPMRGGKTRPRTASISMCKRDLCQSLVVPLWPKRPHLESRVEAHTGGRKSIGDSVFARSANAREEGSHGGWHS